MTCAWHYCGARTATSIKRSAATALDASRVLDPAEVRRFFRIIDERAGHMGSLIGDLLDAWPDRLTLRQKTRKKYT